MDVQAGPFDPGPSVIFSTYENGAAFRVVKHREDRWGLEIDRGAVKYRLAGASFQEVWTLMTIHMDAWKPGLRKQDWSTRDSGN